MKIPHPTCSQGFLPQVSNTDTWVRLILMITKRLMRDHGSRHNWSSPWLWASHLSSYSPTAVQGGHFYLHRVRSWKVWDANSCIFSQSNNKLVSTAFSPHEAHAHNAFFGWVIPTIRISEFTVLQIVGLDAAVVCLNVSSTNQKYTRKSHLGHILVIEFLQNGVHPVFRLLSLCSGHSHACQSEGLAYIIFVQLTLKSWLYLFRIILT